MISTLTGLSVTTGSMRMVSVAGALVTGPMVSVMTTVYSAASANWTFGKLKFAVVAPGMFTPFFATGRAASHRYRRRR